MDILNKLIDKYGDELDKSLMRNTDYNKLMARLNEYCETHFSVEQAKEISEIVGMISSVIFKTSASAGIKLGAKIAVGLLENDN